MSQEKGNRTLQASRKQLDEKIVKSISNLEDVINIEEL